MGVTPPGALVLAAFGVQHEVPHLLKGGQGRAWGAGDLVLKPIEGVAEAEWVATLLAELPEVGFRVSRPVRALTEAWTAGGWAAWHRLAGTHDLSRRWRDVLGAGGAFCAALREVERPAFLDHRQDFWSQGDRVAWAGEPPAVIHEDLRPLVEQFTYFRRPSNRPNQIIHGDLTGNVLFADPAAPAILDFVPYWRPQEFAQAVIVADAIAWHNASADLVGLLPDAEDSRSMVARAAIYRLITADLAATTMAADATAYLSDEIAAHELVLDALRNV